MIEADAFLDAVKMSGADFFTGVPCSFLTPLINRTISDPSTQYVGAASEGEAVAIAAGAWLAGRETVVMCQNSGLGNTVNPLTSLNFPFRIPTVLIVTWRGEPGLGDEPQHELMGEITGSLLDVMRIPWSMFPETPEAIDEAIGTASASLRESRLPYAFIMRKGAVADAALMAEPRPIRARGTLQRETPKPAHVPRHKVLERLLTAISDDVAVVATTGKCGRELFTLADREQHLYQVGSMGGAAGMGLGIALNRPDPVVVLDGDGAALMKLGTLATIGAYHPHGLVHVVLDNGVHDSTGGQPTVSAHVAFAQAALASGYAQAHECVDLDEFDAAYKEALHANGPVLIHMRIASGSLEPLGRPTIAPPDVARRFRGFLTGS